MAMSESKLKMAFEQCRELLPNYLTADRGGTWHRHLIYMCQEAAKFSNREKAMRWLGFIQGALWTNGVATIDELKDMNRPDEPEPRPSEAPLVHLAAPNISAGANRCSTTGGGRSHYRKDVTCTKCLAAEGWQGLRPGEASTKEEEHRAFCSEALRKEQVALSAKRASGDDQPCPYGPGTCKGLTLACRDCLNQEIVDAYEKGKQRSEAAQPESPELLELARKNEDVDAWAAKLAADSCQPGALGNDPDENERLRTADAQSDFIPCIVPPANMRVTKGFY